MPYHIAKSSQCPDSKPWAVIKDSDNSVLGCHSTEADASGQLKAIMANESSNQKNIERRAFTALELRASAGKLGIEGHAAVFNQLSDELWGFREMIKPGAFAQSIQKSDVRALWNHDANFPLARTKNKTLRLREDDIGLAINADLPDTTYARDLLKSIERGDVDQMSFGFTVMPDGENWFLKDGGLVRELTNLELFDVSPVTFPAYPQTDIAIRNLAAAKFKELRKQDASEAAEQFLANVARRREFIDRRTPPPDPYSLEEIIKRARIKRDKKEGD